MKRNRSIDFIFQNFLNENSESLSKKYSGLSLQSLKFAFEDYRTLRNFIYWESEVEEGVNIERNVIDRFLKYVKAGVPLAYITNTSHFLDLKLYVDENVLIPRPETEVLVDEAVKKIKNSGYKKIVDIGTGTGCIILGVASMLKMPLECDAVDISKEALRIAERNLFLNQYRIHPETKLNFKEADRFDGISNEYYDLVISNPPYIMSSEAKTLVHSQVNQHEPHLALYIDDEEYMTWFEDFFKEAFRVLKKNGSLMLEGSEKHLCRLEDIAKSVGFIDVKIVNDLTQSPRFLFAEK